MYSISKAFSLHYDELILIWEESVRATHHFLSEEDIITFRKLIREQYFDAVNLYCARDEHENIVGFIGVLDHNLEMLFIDPRLQGKGIAGMLIKYAINHLQVNKVDVNEQNPNGRAFYEHFAFKVVSRSPLDGTGKPYPILHMQLT
ncbi:MAG: GNAT family N-acetyltransferase [Sphingobacteriales bacterium]|nr:MAG: GNAT family N-acetyltransferase [Sphingobacteriales bacterium]